MAHKVSKSKAELVRLANATTEEWRKSTRAVVAERTELERRMDELKDRVRQPLTDYEAAERERVAGHEAALASITENPSAAREESSVELAARLAVLRSWPARDWQEFHQRAAETLEAEIERAERRHEIAVKREADAAELARLRAQAAEAARVEAARVQAEHEARIAQEAAEQARKAAVREAAEALNRAEQERLSIEREAQAAEERAAKAEADRLAVVKAAEEAQEQARRQRILAEAAARTKLREAEEDAQRRERKAVEAERRRVEREAEELAEANRKREANKAHRASIMYQVRTALIGLGIEEVAARGLVLAIVGGQVPHTTINF